MQSKTNISYKDLVTSDDVRRRIQDAVWVHDYLITMLKKENGMAIFEQDDSARNSENNKKKRTTEKKMGRQHRRFT